MHIEKNVCDVLYVMPKDKKSKDHFQASRSKRNENKKDFWLDKNGKIIYLLFTMTTQQRNVFL